MKKGTGMGKEKFSITMETSLKDNTLMARLLRGFSTSKVETLKNVSIKMEKRMATVPRNSKMVIDSRACM